MRPITLSFPALATSWKGGSPCVAKLTGFPARVRSLMASWNVVHDLPFASLGLELRKIERRWNFSKDEDLRSMGLRACADPYDTLGLQQDLIILLLCHDVNGCWALFH